MRGARTKYLFPILSHVSDWSSCCELMKPRHFCHSKITSAWSTMDGVAEIKPPWSTPAIEKTEQSALGIQQG